MFKLMSGGKLGSRVKGVGAMTTVGIIGAGHIGSQFARLAVGNGHNVVISNSRGPETLSALIAELGPKAHAATAVEAAKAGDIVVVSVIVGVDHDFARQGLDLDLERITCKSMCATDEGRSGRNLVTRPPPCELPSVVLRSPRIWDAPNRVARSHHCWHARVQRGTPPIWSIPRRRLCSATPYGRHRAYGLWRQAL